ncbi:cytochrome P460 family protein [Granulosicoccus antarcticus]|uniref:Cytochrome P460 domain-containing protein n=1 Tax=Granulosicoccus antarcticus IMCC3135 TaxID=1192854 RepID=A0A2Z2NGL5_9GAMM|nr:cytochrome P460 family protein [Granulosicoccus antarcticus]ASJ70203.1 hypothetical protein IMCC3135_00385 [Granulosicoccus antarcticus IMCC3135]
MKHTKLAVTVIAIGFLLGGCGIAERAKDLTSKHDADSVAAPGLKDGELAVPSNYREWPVFLADIDKVDAKQIRDIYISPIGSKTKEGEAFPVGTIAVMEIWNPQMSAAGNLEMDSNGKLIKADLKSVFLMGKSVGAGAMVPESLRNGDWVYASYQADGVTSNGPDATACRACHVPQADKDWVHRYDEYFASRAH